MKRIGFFIIIILLVLVSTGIFAKRAEPILVKPVIIGNVMYTAIHDDMGYVQAWDRSTKKLLWKKKIYSVFRKPGLERDVQDVYIRDMKKIGSYILILNEKNRIYWLKTEKKKVSKLKFENYSKHFEARTKFSQSRGFFKDNDNFAFKFLSRNKNEGKVETEFERIFHDEKCIQLLITYLCRELGSDMDNYFFLYDEIGRLIRKENIVIKKTYRVAGFGTLIEIIFYKKSFKEFIDSLDFSENE